MLYFYYNHFIIAKPFTFFFIVYSFLRFEPFFKVRNLSKYFNDTANIISKKWYEMMISEDFRVLTPLIYTHVNLYGNFNLDVTQMLLLHHFIMLFLDKTIIHNKRAYLCI